MCRGCAAGQREGCLRREGKRRLLRDSVGRAWWARPMLFVWEKKKLSYTLAGDESGAAAVGDIMAASQNLNIGMAT